MSKIYVVALNFGWDKKTKWAADISQIEKALRHLVKSAGGETIGAGGGRDALDIFIEFPSAAERTAFISVAKESYPNLPWHVWKGPANPLLKEEKALPFVFINTYEFEYP